ncbi:MAG: transcriptional repressor LexA [Lachnospiraceae bacterium]|nr:MAG: repressor LexA [Clostridiales bacterium 41_12_two_minus]
MAYGKISAKQQEILEYIKDEILHKGYPPAVREICQAVNLKSTSSVHSHLETLEKNGYIRRDPTKPRAIEIMDDTFNLNRREMVNVPILGNVAAGEPLFAEENIEDYFPIPAEMVPNSEVFMLHVRGESMINVGILDGDNVLVQQQNTAKDGEMVVALVEDSATVKTFYKEDGYIRLQPENDTMEPIIVPDCQILGKVFGIFRFLR